MEKAVYFLSGRLDSATCLALARRDWIPVLRASFDYGQRHKVELICRAPGWPLALGATRHLVAGSGWMPSAGRR